VIPGPAWHTGNFESRPQIVSRHRVGASERWRAGNFADVIALDSTISFPNQSAGPDSYALIDTGTIALTVPEPTSLALLTLALAGLGLVRRRRG
jgi:hypothetical protein